MTELEQENIQIWEEIVQAVRHRKRQKKIKLTLSVDEEVVKQAKELGLNISSITENALNTYITWLEKKKVVAAKN